MGTPAPLAATPHSNLSDEELIELLPASNKEKYLDRATPADEEIFKEDPELFIKPAVKEVLHELWNRHYPSVERKVRSKLWRICPLQYGDPDSFVREALNDAYLAFIRRIKSRDAKGQKYSNFSGYVYTLFLNVGRDKARAIIGRPPGDQDEEEKVALPEHGAPPATKSATRGKKTDVPARPIHVPLDAASDVSLDETPAQKFSREELVCIIKRVIDKHAIDNPISTQTVLLQSQEHNWTKVTKAVMPPEVVEKSLRRRIDVVKDLCEKDCLELGRDLSEYGITSEHVFHFKEAGSGTPTPEEE